MIIARSVKQWVELVLVLMRNKLTTRRRAAWPHAGSDTMCVGRRPPVLERVSDASVGVITVSCETSRGLERIILYMDPGDTG